MKFSMPTIKVDRERFCVNDEDVLTLADYAIKVEDHYSALAGHAMPMDGYGVGQKRDDRLLYVLQARPDTASRNSRPPNMAIKTPWQRSSA